MPPSLLLQGIRKPFDDVLSPRNTHDPRRGCQHYREQNHLTNLRDTWYLADPPFEVPVIRSHNVNLVFHDPVY